MSTTAGKQTADIDELLDRLGSGDRAGHVYAALLGMRRYDAKYLRDRIDQGLSYAAYEKFVRNTALAPRVVADLADISERTLARRKASGKLESDESDRLARLSRIFARAIELFEGDVSSARGWLTQPLDALAGWSPLEFARTDAGAVEVENLVGRLELGIPV